MLDQLYGRPSSSYKRTQVLLVLLFWITRLRQGHSAGLPVPLLRRLSRWVERKRYTPWQVVVSTLMAVYAIRNSDSLLGLMAPEPLARLYSRNYYRATWIVTALDTGFATAMAIRPKWLRDIFSILFSVYYLIFANEGDEKLRKYRAVCTVEMLRATWEKMTNPYLRFLSRKDRPRIKTRKRILLPRPKSSQHTRPITAWLYYDGTAEQLEQQTDLIFDLPGGGFICMSPLHHEERLLRWAIKTQKVVVSFDYVKAPEYPYPFAIDEAFDAYCLLHGCKGKILGMGGQALNVVLTGDSAGANIATALMVKILESNPRPPSPVALVYAYAALSFHFTSWMPDSDLRVLRQAESSSNVASLLLKHKAHLDQRGSPLTPVVELDGESRHDRRRAGGASAGSSDLPSEGGKKKRTSSWSRLTQLGRRVRGGGGGGGEDEAYSADDEEAGRGRDDGDDRDDRDKSLSERVRWTDPTDSERTLSLHQQEAKVESVKRGPLETRLAMTSRTAFFNDRIISPSMCRAMALLYIGPRNAPDLHSDYHISPIFTPSSLLAQFPPIYLSCGERDPFVDDTVIFAGKLREAKEARKLEALGRTTKFGEGLRMSAGPGSPARDPILDEDEEDWVQMRIMSGWSHGYLQMPAILPGSWAAMDLMGDWIVTAFDKAKPITKSARLAAPAAVVTQPTPPPRARKATVTSPPVVPAVTALKDAQQSEDDDQMLSFTPKRRNSRTASPAPTSSSSSVGTTTDDTSVAASSSTSTVHKVPSSAQSSSSRGTGGSRAAVSSADTRAIRRMSSPASSGRAPHRPVLCSEDESSFLSPPHPSGSRRGSHGDSNGAASAAVAARDGEFVDPVLLLRRRRQDAVYGISQTSSAVVSDDSGDDGGGGGGSVSQQPPLLATALLGENKGRRGSNLSAGVAPHVEGQGEDEAGTRDGVVA